MRIAEDLVRSLGQTGTWSLLRYTVLAMHEITMAMIYSAATIAIELGEQKALKEIPNTIKKYVNTLIAFLYTVYLDEDFINHITRFSFELKNKLKEKKDNGVTVI